MDAAQHIKFDRGTLMTAKDVQAALHCCATKVWMLAKDGHLTRIKFGTRMTRFRAEQVLELMERGI